MMLLIMVLIVACFAASQCAEELGLVDRRDWNPDDECQRRVQFLPPAMNDAKMYLLEGSHCETDEHTQKMDDSITPANKAIETNTSRCRVHRCESVFHQMIFRGPQFGLNFMDVDGLKGAGACNHSLLTSLQLFHVAHRQPGPCCNTCRCSYAAS